MVWSKAALGANPLARVVGAVADELAQRGFHGHGIVANLTEVRQFGCWMARRGLGLAEVGWDEFDEYRESRGRSGISRVVSRGRLALLVGIAREAAGLGPLAVPARPAGETGLGSEYRRWLVDERGLAAATVDRYCRAGEVFSLWAAARGVGPFAVGAAEVNGFLVAEARRLKPGTAGKRVAELRSWLRFLFRSGRIPAPLGESVPPVASWRGSKLPGDVGQAELAALAASCASGCLCPARDLAMVLLAGCLGLRSAEIAGLCLDDIDWRGGRLAVRGKGGRVEHMPAPPGVLEALADYVLAGRGCPPGREVFWTVKAPTAPIKPHVVGAVVARACGRAGLDRFGAHRLRHALAAAVLRHGGSLPEAGQVLRHRDAATTAWYAKVDFSSLSRAAAPWPGSAS